MNIYAKTPDGSKFHGYTEGIKFIRNIDGRYVRWSDKSFCLNTSVINKLLDLNIGTLEFRYRMAGKLKIYQVPFFEATRIATTVNEHGEENIRIPIERCKLTKVEDYDKVD